MELHSSSDSINNSPRSDLVLFSNSSSSSTSNQSSTLESIYHEFKKESPTKFLTDIPKTSECPICYNVYKEAVILKNCGHTFCAACIKQALLNSKHCPLCKYVMFFLSWISNQKLLQMICAIFHLEKDTKIQQLLI